MCKYKLSAYVVLAISFSMFYLGAIFQLDKLLYYSTFGLGLAGIYLIFSKEVENRNDVREHLWAKQCKERGFDDRELIALDVTIAKFIVPRLKAFLNVNYCHPHTMKMPEWKNTIQQMIDGFEEFDKENPDVEKMDKGMELFCKHIHALWF